MISYDTEDITKYSDEKDPDVDLLQRKINFLRSQKGIKIDPNNFMPQFKKAP